MFIATIDCGTTNSRVYIVDENGNVITRASQKVGVRDTAIHGNNQVLKDGVREVFNRALQEVGISPSEIHCILSSGMITSELGLIEIPHLWAPCNLDTLAANITLVKDLDVFPPSIPLYFVRGIKNFYDPTKISMQDVGTLDFMRGEEVQVAGLLENQEVKLPNIITILSSHTKLIPVDEEKRILGSVTTLSGQLYEAILKETFVGKSVRSEDDFDNTNYFNPDVVEMAYDEIMRSGFLRGLMYVRFLDTLVHARWYDRKLFAETLIAAEDMRALHQVRELMGLSTTSFILIGMKLRCLIYEHLLKTKVSPECNVSMITEENEIDQLSIQGVLSLAKKAGIL
jgi:2-dehydro-3-deoxygalactonokinase